MTLIRVLFFEIICREQGGYATGPDLVDTILGVHQVASIGSEAIRGACAEP